MTKYDLAKMFCDVDDKYIESARPAPQRAVMIKTRKSPMRIVAAASCAAVLAGGVITVTAVRNRGLSAAGNSNTASITNGSADISNSVDIKDSDDITDSTVSSDERSDNYFVSDHIYYEGEFYTIVKNASSRYVHITDDEWGAEYAVGVRIGSENTIDVVAVIKNLCDKPIGMLGCGDDKAVKLEFGKAVEPDFGVTTDTTVEGSVTKILKPGEELYQKLTVDLFYGECTGELKFNYTGVNGETVTDTDKKHLVFTGTMTEDGFKEHNESADKWAQKPLVLPSKFAPKDLDFIHTTMGYVGSRNTLIPAEEGSEVYAVDGGEVIFADYNNVWNAGFGSVVVIKHGEGLYTIYSGLLPVDKGGKAFVNAGEKVTAGTIIGQAGYSGCIPEYGVYYGFYTELPWNIAEGLSQNQSEAHSSGGGELGLTTDADGDGIPDKLKELNPDVTDEQWELYKKLEHPEEYGLVQIGEDSVTDGEYEMTTKFFVGPVEE